MDSEANEETTIEEPVETTEKPVKTIEEPAKKVTSTVKKTKPKKDPGRVGRKKTRRIQQKSNRCRATSYALERN